ncbi:MAG: translocation/assembly module TamB domain-containing protein, partial [Desulfurivibrionaceae bacterium]|nr:translocation/assembly module TamB domain-containing protein [Desulfurivibrionaceae bacterium]
VLESGVFSTAGALVDLEYFAINRPGPGLLQAGLSLSAGLAADISDLGGIAAIFGVEAVGGGFRATIACDGPLDELRGDIELRGRDLRYRTIGVDTLFLKARTEADGWRIVNLAAVNGDDRLTGSGGIAMAPLHFKELVLDLTLRDFHPYLSWFLTGAVPAAHGELAGQLVLSGSPAAPAGDFRVVLTDAGINGLSISRGELLGGMAGETVEVTKLRVRTSAGEVELAGALEHRAFRAPLTGTIDRLTLTREGLSMQLLAPAAFRLDGLDSWSFEVAALQSEAGSFRMAGGFFPAVGYDFSFRLSEAVSAPLRPLFPDLPVEFSGLNVTGTVRGLLPTPEVALKGSVAELRTSDALVPLAGQFDLLLSARGLVLKTFSWTTAAGERLVLAGTIPYDPYARRLLPTALEVDGLFAVSDLETFTAFLPEAFRVPGRLNGKLSISGSGERPEARIDFHAEGVGFPVSFPVHPPGPISVAAAVVLRDNDLHLDSFTVSGDDFGFTLAGIWRQAGDLLKRGRAADGLPGRLDLRGSFSAGEISWLARGFPAIRRLGGRVEGTLALSGPAAIPDLVAELSLTDGEFRADGALPPLRNLQVQLGFAQRTATVERFSGSIGGAPFTVTGRVLLPAAEEPVADLRVQGANLLLYRSEAVGVRGDADITIRGSFAAPAFAGTFAITDGGLRKNINWLEPLRGIGRSRPPVAGPAGPGGLGLSFRNPPMKDATFAIHVTSKNPFRIKSNVARGNLRPDLWLRGTGEIPLLTGVIYIDRSRIMLPAGKLLVEAGLIRFAEDSPGRALLEISGSSLILGYEINLTVEGSSDEPTVALSSMPPLPQDALLLLLLTGRLPPGVGDRSRGWQEGMRVALYVGKGVLADWFGGNDLDSDKSLLDRFDVVVGRGISRQGNETIGAQYRLADSVMRDGDELYLVAERDVYDEFNTGVRIVFRFK